MPKMKREANSLLRSSHRWLLLLAATAVALFGAWACGGAERSSARRPFLAPANYLDPFNAADARTLAPHYAAFVAEFADEIRSEFAAAEAFAALTKGSSDVVCKGQIGRVEAAMLYVAIRVERPQRVLEVGALCGSSTRWILAALLRNGGVGTLTTFDLHDFAPTFVRPSVETDRWNFVRGDVLAHVREVDAAVATEADLIFVDALHRNAFAREYTRELLGRARRRVLVFAHDIYSPFMIPLLQALPAEHDRGDARRGTALFNQARGRVCRRPRHRHVLWSDSSRR